MRAFALLVVVAGCHRTHEPTNVTELFAGTRAPALVGPMAGVDFKMATASAQQTLKLGETDSLTYAALGDRNGHLREIEINLMKGPDAATDLEKLWGPANGVTTRTANNHEAGTRIWTGDHVMAMLAPDHADMPRHLSMVEFTSLADELGDPAKPLFGFDIHSPIVGNSASFLGEEYKQVYQPSASAAQLLLPYYEAEPFTVSIEYNSANIATAISFEIHANAGQAGAVAALLEKRFGQSEGSFAWHPPCPTKCNTPDHFDVKIETSADTWTVTIAAAS